MIIGFGVPSASFWFLMTTLSYLNIMQFNFNNVVISEYDVTTLGDNRTTGVNETTIPKLNIAHNLTHLSDHTLRLHICIKILSHQQHQNHKTTDNLSPHRNRLLLGTFIVRPRALKYALTDWLWGVVATHLYISYLINHTLSVQVRLVSSHLQNVLEQCDISVAASCEQSD